MEKKEIRSRCNWRKPTSHETTDYFQNQESDLLSCEKLWLWHVCCHLICSIPFIINTIHLQVSQYFPTNPGLQEQVNLFFVTSQVSWHVPPCRQGCVPQHPFWHSLNWTSDCVSWIIDGLTMIGRLSNTFHIAGLPRCKNRWSFSLFCSYC